MKRGIANLRSEPYEWYGLQQAHFFLMTDIIHRRFGVAAFAGSRQRYLATLNPDASAGLRVLARIVDPSVRVTEADLNKLPVSYDRLTGPAVHCDYIPLGEAYANDVREALTRSHPAAGQYWITHALFAAACLRDLGCSGVLSAELEERIVIASAGVIDSNHSEIGDVEIEAAAFLHYFGQGDRVPAGFIDGLLKAQLPDGGWARHTASPSREREADFHSTALAVWLLGELLYPEASEPAVRRGSP
jgi:hypothetical protein